MKIISSFVLVVCLFFSTPAYALMGKSFDFETSKLYEVHYQASHGGTLMINKVKILGIETLGDQKFLIIQIKDPLSERDPNLKGLVAFEKVLTILPAKGEFN